MYEAKSEEELMTHMRSHFSGEPYVGFRALLIAIADGKTTFQHEQTDQTVKGNRIHISLRVTVSLGHEETYSSVIVSFVDLTERKRMEEALNESKRMLSTLISNLPGIVYRYLNDERRTIEFISDGCVELTGYEPSDFVGEGVSSYLDLVHPDDRAFIVKEAIRMLEEAGIVHYVYRIITKTEGNEVGLGARSGRVRSEW